ncbi:MAG: hypothetical protein ABSG60_08310, partial [Terracidiphilus sp.]
RPAPPTYKTFDHVSHKEAESRGEATIMDIFFLGVIGFVLVAFIVFVVASLRLERSHLAEKTPKPEVFGDENNIHRRA